MEKKQGQYKRLFAFAGKFKYLTYASMALSAVSAVCAVVPFVYVWRIVNEELRVMPEYASAVGIRHDGWMAVLFAVIAIVVNLCALMCSHIAAFRIARNIRSQTVHHVALLPDGALDMAGSGKIRRIIDQSSAATETFLAHQTPDMAGACVTPVAIVVMLFIFDWRLGIASLLPVLIAFAIMTRMTGKRMQDSMKQYTDALEDMSNEMVEYVRGVAVVKTFGQTSSSFSRMKASITRYEKWTTAYTCELRKPMMPFTLLINGVFAFLIGAGFMCGDMNASPEFISNFIFYVIFTPIITITLNKIMFSSENKMVVSDAMNRIESLLSMNVLPETALPRVPSAFDVTLHNVTFAYKGTVRPAVDHVSFSVPSGSCAALVGPSGGGKTTLASLVARAWDPDSGSVKIGGADIRDIPKVKLMQIVSCVFQDSKLLRMSLLENIRLGRPSASREEVIAALHAAQCDDIIQKLPLGIDTMYGAKGVYLSGGECQRLALARVVLNNTPVVVLDEATAFADPENEYLMQRAFKELAKNKTVIKIAHRLSTVKDADCIYVLKDGAVVESGTHDALLKNGSVYSQMWTEYEQSAKWHV